MYLPCPLLRCKLGPTGGGGRHIPRPRPRLRPLPGNWRPRYVIIHATGIPGRSVPGTRLGHLQARAGGCRDCEHGPGRVRLV
jgi:hypothetical protein